MRAENMEVENVDEGNFGSNHLLLHLNDPASGVLQFLTSNTEWETNRLSFIAFVRNSPHQQTYVTSHLNYL